MIAKLSMAEPKGPFFPEAEVTKDYKSTSLYYGIVTAI